MQSNYSNAVKNCKELQFSRSDPEVPPARKLASNICRRTGLDGLDGLDIGTGREVGQNRRSKTRRNTRDGFGMLWLFEYRITESCPEHIRLLI